MGFELVPALINGGAVGLSLALIYVVYQQNKSQERNNALLNSTLLTISEEHRKTIDRNTDAWLQNTQVLAILNERIK